MSHKLVDLTGKRFGHLVVTGRAENYPSGGRRWYCACDCGNEVVRDGPRLRGGNVSHCGCQHDRAVTHGKSGTPEHRIWLGIRSRCNNPNRKGYQQYGAKGIRICKRWEDFDAFLEDMGPRPTPEHSVDRIDGTGNYEPSNCRWATRVEQVNNRRNTRMVVYRGNEIPLTDAVRQAGSVIHHEAAWVRIQTGWSVKRAVETPRLHESHAAKWHREQRERRNHA